MVRQTVRFSTLSIVVLATCSAITAQKAQKPLTNDDVIAMVHKKLPESVILSAIQSGPAKFDTSANELIRLNGAGVTEKELNAMMAAPGSAAGAPSAAVHSSPSAPEPSAPIEAPVSKSHMPKAYLAQGGALKELSLERTQLAETKAKPTSMKSLAGDSALGQAMQAGVNTAAWDAAGHINSPVGGSAVGEAGGVFSGIMAHRQPKVTYVWGVPGPASTDVLQTTSPTFTVDFSRVLGATPDDYQPMIVKLTPAQNTCRIIGATEAKADASSSPGADWQVYSHFLEEPVQTQAEKLGTGKYKVSAKAELAPGEYGLVLRPIEKSKKFSGGDVARAQGDGLMFDAVWTFKISDDAQ